LGARVLLTVSTDGFVSEAGEAGWAFVVRGGGRGAGSVGDATRRGRLPAGTTSHEAEWRAMLEALAFVEADARLAPGDEVELRTDSALVAKGLASRKPAMSGAAAEARAACRQALARLGARGVRARVVRVPREANKEADRQSRRR